MVTSQVEDVQFRVDDCAAKSELIHMTALIERKADTAELYRVKEGVVGIKDIKLLLKGYVSTCTTAAVEQTTATHMHIRPDWNESHIFAVGVFKLYVQAAVLLYGYSLASTFSFETYFFG